MTGERLNFVGPNLLIKRVPRSPALWTLNILLWEGLPWLLAFLAMMCLQGGGEAQAAVWILPNSSPAAEQLRWRLLFDLVVAQAAASLVLFALRKLWPQAVIHHPWPFIKNCLLDPLLGAVVIVLIAYSLAILAVGPSSITRLARGYPLLREELPLFY